MVLQFLESDLRIPKNVKKKHSCGILEKIRKNPLKTLFFGTSLYTIFTKSLMEILCQFKP